MTWLQSIYRIRNRRRDLFAPLLQSRRFGVGTKNYAFSTTGSGWLMMGLVGGGGLCWITHRHEQQPTKCHGGSGPSQQQQRKRKRQIEDFIHNDNENNNHLLSLPEYTSEEVAKRNGQQQQQDDDDGGGGGPIWVSYGGYVYSVKEFIPFHPGGTERISRAAGSALEPFWFLHQQHYDTQEPMEIMKTLVVGRLAQADQERIDAQLESLQQELESFRLVLDLSQLGGRQKEITKSLSLNDLKGFPKTDLKSPVGCPNRNQGNNRRPLPTSIFGGVLLKELLIGTATNTTLVGESIQQLIFHAMDGEKVTLDLDNNDDDDNNNNNNDYYETDILICYEMDGAPLTKKRGFPLRVIIPGDNKKKRRVVKWVQKIEVVGCAGK